MRYTFLMWYTPLEMGPSRKTEMEFAARDMAAKLVAMVGSGLPRADVEPLLQSHVVTAGALETEGAKKGSRMEDRLGSIAVTGYLLAQLHDGA